MSRCPTCGRIRCQSPIVSPLTLAERRVVKAAERWFDAVRWQAELCILRLEDAVEALRRERAKAKRKEKRKGKR